MGAAEDDENQWEFKGDLELTQLEKKRVISEVMRLGVEIMYGTYIYTFGGRNYKQREGGLIGLRSTCALQEWSWQDRTANGRRGWERTALRLKKMGGLWMMPGTSCTQ